MGRGDTLLNAVIGAVITVGLSFTGFSPLVGGGVAGYLQQESRRDGAKVGALAGALAFLPFLLLIVLFFGFFLAVPVTQGGMPGGFGLLIILFILFPLLLVWNVGLGAIGGYLGTYLREELDASGGRPD